MSSAAAITTILLLFISGSVTNVESAHHSAAPAPAAECSTVILNMADCLTYVSAGSVVKKPEGTCCSGLKTVLKSDAECLCEAFKNSAQLGVALNITKAMALPTACHLTAPSVSNCGLNLGVATTPALSPALSPASFVLAPSTSIAPVPVPGSSGSSMLVSSVVTLVSGLLVAASHSLF